MNEINESISYRNFDKALEFCMDFELSMPNLNLNAVHETEFYCKYFILYLLTSKYHFARHLWYRIPTQLKSTELLNLLWNTLKYLWNRLVYDCLNNLIQFQFPEYLNPLILQLIEKIREDEFMLIGRKYISYSVQELSNLLCLELSTTTQLCIQRNWSVNLDTGFVYPSHESTLKVPDISMDYSISLTELTESLALLERKQLIVEFGTKAGNQTSSSLKSPEILELTCETPDKMITDENTGF